MGIRIDHGPLDRPFLLVYLEQRQGNGSIHGRYAEEQDGRSAPCCLESLFRGKCSADAFNDDIHSVISRNFTDSLRNGFMKRINDGIRSHFKADLSPSFHRLTQNDCRGPLNACHLYHQKSDRSATDNKNRLS